MGRYDEAVVALEKARFHSERMEEYDKQSHYSFTAPLFDKLSGDKEHNNLTSNAIDVFINYINNNSCFNSIRNRQEVLKLLKR